jgi:endonuclease YncB( thermonuclease family)
VTWQALLGGLFLGRLSRHVLALEHGLNPESARSTVLSLALAICLAAAAGGAGAAQWIVEGRVVGVSDGDTITVLDGSKGQHLVRLSGIDAPERKQPFGSAAKEVLSSAVFDRRVEARCWKRDRYGREICSVFVGTRDVGLAMIRDGYAWHYKAFEQEQSAEDRAAYARTEADARSARRGLWRDAAPVPP